MDPRSPPGNEAPSPPQARSHHLLDEALQHTPLTSINPFDTDIIPCPIVGPTTASLPLLSDTERLESGRVLQSFDREISNQGNSHRAEQTLDDLRHFLNAADLTEYRFAPVPTLAHSFGGTPGVNGHLRTSEPPRLGQFAMTLLNTTNVSYEHRYPTPVSPAPDLLRSTTGKRISNDDQSSLSHNLPGPIKVEEPATSTTPKRSLQGHMVVIPPSPGNLAEYKAFPQIDAAIIEDQQANSKKRKRAHENGVDKLHDGDDFDLIERSKTTLQQLKEVLCLTFEAEDRLEPDTAGSTRQCNNEYFETSSFGEAQFVLTASAISRVDSAIAKAIDTKRFHEVDAEHLGRLQKLCHKTILQSANTELAFPSSEDTFNEWAAKLEAADSSLLAARAILRIMSAEREEKELYSQELLADLLAMLKQVLEDVVIPVVERSAHAELSKLKPDAQTRTLLSNIAQRIGRVLKLFGDLLLSVDVLETAVTTVEDLSIKLVFVSNASSEKDSVIGIQRYETLRRSAMDVLARIFLKSPAERGPILDEILSSLEKLPITRQSARHFRVHDRKPIQLVSALIMQLIQTAATKTPEKHVLAAGGNDLAVSEEESDDGEPSRTESKHADVSTGSLASLMGVGKPLLATIRSNANHIVGYLIGRALKSSKTGDEPYRNLLDIFTEDFVNVLGSTDWPAADLLLEVLLIRLLAIVDNEKSAAPAKNMALDLMGIMGAGIADVKHSLEQLSRMAEDEGGEKAQHLIGLSQTFMDGERLGSGLISLGGPFHYVIEHLGSRAQDDLQLQNARNFLVLRWAAQVWISEDSSQSVDADVVRMLDNGLRDCKSLSHTGDFAIAAPRLGQLSYALLILHTALCRATPRIFSTLVQALGSQHATVRSKGLKSVINLLEKDPSMLDSSGNVLRHILRASADNSTMVRDSALGLLGRCMALKTGIEEQCLETLIPRSSDSAVGIRKRAVALLKTVYSRNSTAQIRSDVAIALLARLNDSEESIRDMTRQTLEDLWIDPFASAACKEDAPLSDKNHLQSHAEQLVAIADKSSAALQSFEPLFHSLLEPTRKNVQVNRRVCKAIVRALFDTFIENDQRNAKKSRGNILTFLAIFAQAGHHIFDVNQLKLLQAYTENLKTKEDLVVLAPVTSIYTATLPHIPATHRDFVLAIHTNLKSSLSVILETQLLDSVTKCLWALDQYLQNTVTLARVFCSVMQTFQRAKDTETSKAAKMITLAGYCAKNWSVDAHLKLFRDAFPAWKGDEVSDLVITLLGAFAKPERAANVQQAALRGICLTCQSWPKNYLKKEVSSLLDFVFEGHDKFLQLVAIQGFRDFFTLEESRAQRVANNETTGGSVADSSDRLGQSMVLSDNDGAATFLAQKYLKPILRLALASIDEIAVTATELITSTNRQGLVHPRESGYVLVAMETSPNKRIARLAYDEHLSLNTKHESILEKEYLKAIEQSFRYQRDTIKDSSGITKGCLPKLGLFFDVLKQGSVGARKKLLTNLCKRLDFNPSKTTVSQLEEHYMYAKYVCENLALVEHSRVDEIMAVTRTFESIFATTGNTLSQQIESFLAQSVALQDHDPSSETLPKTLTALYPNAISSTILVLLWHTRTYLRAITTNIPSTSTTKSTSSNKTKERLKDNATKPPIRPTNTPALTDAYLQRIDLAAPFASEASMRAQLDVFMELHSIDLEAKVGSTSDDEMDLDLVGSPTTAGASNGVSNEGRMFTPSVDGSVGDRSVSISGGGGGGGEGKRKRSSVGGSVASTPSKSGRPRGRPSLGKRKSSSNVGRKGMDEDGEEGWD